MTACLVLKMNVVCTIQLIFLIFKAPGNVGHRKVSLDSVVKTLGVVWHVVKVPDCLARLGDVTVPHLWHHSAPHYLVPIWLQHQVATGDVNNLAHALLYIWVKYGS